MRIALSSFVCSVVVASSFPGASAQTAEVSAAPAPIVHQYADHRYGDGGDASSSRLFSLRPAPGVAVRSDVKGGVKTVSAAGSATEIRVDTGRAEVLVRHPGDGSQILVDLPGGQVALIKDGVYTFNAETDTARVLHGEAVAYRGASDDSKGTKIKEAQELNFAANTRLRAVDASRAELAEDLLGGRDRQYGDGADGFYGGGAYGGPGYGFYGGGDPYLEDGFGGPWGYGGYGGYGFGGYGPYGFAPYGFGYPFGIGLGFGYYGGFGGYRGFGGYGGRFGGFRGGGFRR